MGFSILGMRLFFYRSFAENNNRTHTFVFHFHQGLHCEISYMFGHLTMFQFLFNWKLEYYFPVLLGVSASVPGFESVRDACEISQSVDVVIQQDSWVNEELAQSESGRSFENSWGGVDDIPIGKASLFKRNAIPGEEASAEISTGAPIGGEVRTQIIQNRVSE